MPTLLQPLRRALSAVVTIHICKKLIGRPTSRRGGDVVLAVLTALLLVLAPLPGKISTAFGQGATATATTSCGLLQGRTQKVVDAIVDAIPGVADCAQITEAHLATIRTLDLRNQALTTLQAGDFAGLTRLRDLYLDHNQLTTLPAT